MQIIRPVSLINVMRQMEADKLNEDKKLSSLLNDSGRRYLRENYPVSLILADRLCLYRVVGEDRLVFIDKNWVDDRMTTNLYEGFDDLVLDIDSFSTTTSHLTRIDILDIRTEAMDTLESSPEENLGVQEQLVLTLLAEESTRVQVTTATYEPIAPPFVLHPFVVRTLIRTFLEIMDATKGNSDPVGYAIVDEAFAAAESMVAAPVTENEWDF